VAFIYKRGKVYYVGYRVTVLDENGNKVRKQVSAPISPDKQAADEFAAKKTLHPEYRDILHKMWQYGEGKSNFFLFTQLKHNRLSPLRIKLIH
jgi:hypothetical protein